MLGHQLPALPPFDSFWAEVPNLFAWLAGDDSALPLAPIGIGADEDAAWSPPPTVWTWGQGFSLESVRFAAANRLCVQLGYHGSTQDDRAIFAPSNARRLLAAARHPSGRPPASVVSRGADNERRGDTRPFRPVYQVEFSSSGMLAAPPARGAVRALTAGRIGTERLFVVECPRCNRQFRRKTRTTELRPHKDAGGFPCYGRRGQIVDETYG